MIIFTIVLSALVIIAHRNNFARLINGNENNKAETNVPVKVTNVPFKVTNVPVKVTNVPIKVTVVPKIQNPL